MNAIKNLFATILKKAPQAPGGGAGGGGNVGKALGSVLVLVGTVGVGSYAAYHSMVTGIEF